MKYRMMCATALVLLLVSLGSADLLTERKRENDQSVAPFGARSYFDTFKENKRALAIVSGKGITCMGLYVYDEFGNCVARDDVTVPQACDDLAADWVPSATARFDIIVVNGGNDRNMFDVAIR